MKGIIILLLIGLLLMSCSPQKRLKRLLDKHPQFTKVDTVHTSDTIIIPSKASTGSTNFNALLDLLNTNQTATVVTNQNDTVKMNVVNDTLYLALTTPPDTIVRLDTLYIPKIYVPPSKIKIKWHYIPIFLIVMLFLISVFKFRDKSHNL